MAREKSKKIPNKKLDKYGVITIPLSDEIYKKIKLLKYTSGISYNLLFKKLIDLYDGRKL